MDEKTKKAMIVFILLGILGFGLGFGLGFVYSKDYINDFVTVCEYNLNKCIDQCARTNPDYYFQINKSVVEG